MESDRIHRGMQHLCVVYGKGSGQRIVDHACGSRSHDSCSGSCEHACSRRSSCRNTRTCACEIIPKIIMSPEFTGMGA